mgnify:CR=1 FL=1
MTEDDKYALYALIEQNVSNDDIVEQLELSLATVIRMRKQYIEHKASGTLAKILNVDRMIIHQAAQSLDLTQEGKELVKKVDNYTKLCEELQFTAGAINNKLKSLVLSAETAAELSLIADTLCCLQNAFAVKHQTNVNVQNNFATNYEDFLGDKPGA